MIPNRLFGRKTDFLTGALTLILAPISWRIFLVSPIVPSALGLVLLPFAIARLAYLIHNEREKGKTPFDSISPDARYFGTLTTSVIVIGVAILWITHLIWLLQVLLSVIAIATLAFSLPWLLAEGLSYTSMPIWQPAENCRIRRRMPELRANAFNSVADGTLLWMSRASLKCIVGDEHTFNRAKLYLGPDRTWMYVTNMGWIGEGPLCGASRRKGGLDIGYFELSARERLAYFS